MQEKFMFFKNFADTIRQAIPSEKQGEAYKAICEFALYDEKPSDPMLLGMCLMAMPSLFKQDGRKNNGGNHNPQGKNQHTKEVKLGQSGQSGQSGQFLSETETETETETEAETETEEKELPFESSTKKESTSSVPDTSRGVTERKNHIEDNFNELWSIYKPYKTNSGRVVNKGGRTDALRAYKNALKRGTHEEIKRGIYGYLKSCKENDTLSAMFSTFLNKDYWEEFKTFRCPEIDAKPVEKTPKVENTFEATFEYMEKKRLQEEAEEAEWAQIKEDLLKYAERKNGDNR